MLLASVQKIIVEAFILQFISFLSTFWCVHRIMITFKMSSLVWLDSFFFVEILKFHIL